MPDESSAAREHAIMQQITAPLAELPDDPVATVANQDFPAVLRGYDRVAVEQLIRLRDHGVSAPYIQKMRDRGYSNLSLDELINLRDRGTRE